MDTHKFDQNLAFHVDSGWNDAHWLQKARAHATRTLAQSIARLSIAGFIMLRARRAVSAMPAEGSSFLDRDEVANANSILLGQ